ncbi:MAG: response regulator, partial [Alphaproteobacteria bacterium]|nr:response regulator [Alphaproteobacteria bacterium]
MPPPDRRRASEPGPSITLIEDDAVMGGSLAQRLALERYRVSWHRTGRKAIEALQAAPTDAVICDIRLPDMDGEDLYATLRSGQLTVPVIFITGYGEIDQAVRLVKAGAADYLAKPFEVRALLERLSEALPAGGPAGVLGPSQAMRLVEATLRRVADLDSTLLITGESGVGK